MSSDPAQDQLKLTLDDVSINADGSDATRVTFRALDAFGNQRPYVSGDVSLDVSGPAQLIGDNPFAFATFGGVGGAFVRSLTNQTGPVIVSASHPSLGCGTGQLEVVPAPANYR
jgi:beta-galactosidase